MNKSMLLKNGEQQASAILKEFPPEYSLHNYEYAKRLVKAVQEIGVAEKLSESDLVLAQLAAWFQFTGFRKDYKIHLENSREEADAFLTEAQLDPEKKKLVLEAIMAMEGEGIPKNKIEEVLLDANNAYVLKEHYKKYNADLRKELKTVKKETYSDIDWIGASLETVSHLTYYTKYGKETLHKSKEKVRMRLEKQMSKFQKVIDENLINVLGVTTSELKDMKKKLQKAQGRPERGIETMFRLTSKNHLDLSGMADSKANIMISVNSIIISILIGGLMQKLDTNPHLVVPTIILLTVNLTSMICSIISIRPTVTNGLFNREDIENQKTNLLFFGNFHKMNREDYHWGMNTLMSNSDYLYSSLIDDIYFLGVVLAKKYKFLRYSYNIFMIGIVIAVLAFVIANFMAETVASVG